MATPLKPPEAVVSDLLKYLDGRPDPAEVPKSKQYADWKALCQRVSGNWNTAQNVVTALRNNLPLWCDDICECKAGDLLAELMMAMQPSQLYIFESKSRGPKLASKLARIAHKQLSSPRPAEQMSSAQLMLKLGRFSTRFAKEVAGMPALVARVGALVLQRGDASTALITVMDQWVADYKARPALISTLSSLLLDSNSTDPQAAQHGRHDLTDRVTACHILDTILRAQSSNAKVAAGKLALEATARLVQGVLMLLHDMQAAHTPAVSEQAATDPSTVSPSKTKMRLKKPKFKNNSTKTTATMPAPAPQAPAPQPPHAPPASTLKAGATAQVSMAAVAAAAAALASQPAAAAGASAAVGNLVDAAPQGPPSSPVQAPAAAPAAMDSATAATAPVADPVAPAVPSPRIPPAAVPAPTAAAAAPAPAAPVAGGPAQALQDSPHSSVASLPVQLLVPVINTFMRLTIHDPGYVTEQLVSNPGDLHTLLHLLEPSAEQLQCRQQAAATVLACLTWASAPHRHKHPFLELYLSSPQAVASTGHILQLVPPAEGLFAISALLQRASQDSSTRNRSTRRKPNTDLSTKPSAGPSTGSGSNSTGSGAANLAAAPALLPTLLQLLQKPASAGPTTSALNLLYPSCTPAQQLQLAQDPACIEALTQLLSMPKNSPVEPISAAAAAQMLLQLLKTNTDAVLQASRCTDTLVSRLLSAVCPGAAAAHAADALSTLAGSPTGAACLSAPSAIEQLFKLTTAAQDAGSWQPLHKSLAGQYKFSLSRIPLIVCKLAVSTPGTLSKLQGCSPTASSVLAAALHLHYSNALPTAAVGLGKKWPALKQELKRLEEQRQRWQEWQQREQQEAQLLKGLQLPEGGAATQGDVSFGRWAPESPTAADMDDTAASPQPSRTASARSDRMSTDSDSGLGDAGAEQRGPAALFPAAAQTEEPKEQGRLRGRDNNSTLQQQQQQQQEQSSGQQQVKEQLQEATDSEMQHGQHKDSAEVPGLMPPQAAPAAAAAVKQPPSSPKRSAAGRAPEPPAKLPAAGAAAGNGPCPDLHAAAELHRQQQHSEDGADCKSPVLNPAWLPMPQQQQPVTARTARLHARRHQQQQALAATAAPTAEQAPTQEQQQQDAAPNAMAETMGPSADKPGKPAQQTAAQAKGPAAASQPNPDYMAMHKASTSSSVQQQLRKLLSCQAPAAGIAPAKAVLQAASASSSSSSSSSSSKITYTQLEGPKALPKGLKRHWQNDICCVAVSIDGAIWGYGWGPDAEAAEAAAAEAAVGNMHVSGVSFEGLPPYTGGVAEPEKPQGRSLSAAMAAIGK